MRRCALRLTDKALAELCGHIDQVTAWFASRANEGTWTRVVVALADLEDRPNPATVAPGRQS